MKLPFGWTVILVLNILCQNGCFSALIYKVDPVEPTSNYHRIQKRNNLNNSDESYQVADLKAVKFKFNPDKFPNNFDWRTFGAVTPVRDQTSGCGACWAIAAVGAVEGALFVHSGMKELVRLSEQALIDCSWEYGNDGCDGGFTYAAFKWIMNNGGIPTDESYGKYKAKKDTCHLNDPGVVLKAPIIGWIRVRNEDPYEMKRALLKYGPIAATIHTTDSFKRYGPSRANRTNEVFFDAKCKNAVNELTHSVLVVGYGKNRGGEEYWIIKNSHGLDWGDDGYMLMAARDNHCGVLTNPTYPMFDISSYKYERFLIFLKDPLVRRFALALAIAIAACIFWNIFGYIKQKCVENSNEEQNHNEEMIELN